MSIPSGSFPHAPMPPCHHYGRETMAGEVRFGIVGLGMGRGRARKAVETPGSKLMCVCALEEEQAKTAAEELACDWTTDYDEMLARNDIDAVGVMTPSGLHADFAIKAVASGRHTFTTKPMDIRLEKCDALIDAAEKAGVILAVDFDSRYVPSNHQIRQGVQSGTLGRILFGDLRMKWLRKQEYYDGGSPPGWRSRKITEGGSIANQGVHYVDLLQWFLGPVESVYARSATLTHDIETEDATQAMITFGSGAWGTIQTTTCNIPNAGTVMEISGTDGMIVWKNNQVELWHMEGDPEATPDAFAPPEDLPGSIIEDMVSAITRGTPVAVDGYEGRKAVAIFNAAYESARTGAAVKVDHRERR